MNVVPFRKKLDFAANTLPITCVNEFKRDNLIDSIEKSLNTNNSTVLITGESFSGKTTVLKQFYEEYQSETAAYFIQNDIYKDSMILMISDLCKQLLPMTSMKVKTRISEDNFDEFNVPQLIDAFGRIYNDLCTQAKKGNKKVFILIDGLDKLPSSILDELLNWLPKGDVNGVFIILSVTTNSTIHLPHKHLQLNIPYFSLPETHFILGDKVGSKIQIDQIQKFCSGLPPYINELSIKLAEDKEVLESEFFLDLPDNFQEYLERLWLKFESKYTSKLILGILVVSPYPIPKKDIIKLLELKTGEFEDAISEMDFLKYEEEDIICPPIYKSFLDKKLNEVKSESIDVLIKYYEYQNKEDPSTIGVLSKLYNQTGNYEKLKNILNTKTFISNLEQIKDFSSTKNHLKLLEEMSYSEEDWSTYTSAIFPGSLLSNVNRRSPALEEDIKTLLTLKEYQDALNLAYSCSLRDDRCYLLSLVSRTLKIDSNEMFPNVLVQIKEIVESDSFYDDISEDRIDKLINISTNLFPVDMDLSLRIVKKIVENKPATSSKDKLMDYMLLKLFLKIDTENNDSDSVKGYIGELSSSIEKEEFKDFLSVAVTSNIKTFEEVRKKAESVSDTSAKMFYLINWCINNEENEELYKVANYVLDFFSQSVDHSFTMRDLRYLVTSILNINHEKELKELLIKIERAKKNLLNTPLQEFIKVELGIALIEKKINIDNFYERYLELVIFTDETVNDLDDKAILYSNLLSSYKLLLGDSDKPLYDEIRNNLIEAIKSILENSANQYAALHEAFYEISKYDYDLSCELLKGINTEKSRFRIYQNVCRGFLEKNTFSYAIVENIFKNFSDQGYQDYLLHTLIKEISLNNYPLESVDGEKIFSAILKIRTTHLKAICLGYLWTVEKLNESIKSKVYEKIKSMIDDIEEYSDKKRIGYYVIQTISRNSINIGRNLYDQINGKMPNNTSDSELNLIVKNLVELSIVSLPEVIKNPDPIFYVKTVCSHIERISESSTKVYLYNELGIKLISLKRLDLLSIFQEEYSQLITREWSDKNRRYELITHSSTLLYLINERFYFKILNEVDYIENKENSVLNVIKFLLTSRSSNDIFDFENFSFTTDINNLMKSLDLINQLQEDINIATCIRLLVQTLENSVKKNEYTIREGEIINVYNDVLQIIDRKLPDKNNISHNGYSLLIKSYFMKFLGMKLRNQKIKNELPKIESLHDELNSIPNTADRIFIMCTLAENYYISDMNLAIEMLKKAEEQAFTLKTFSDRIDRIEQIVQIYHTVGSKNAAEHLLRTLFEIVISKKKNNNLSDDIDLESIIELAHKVNPELAQTLSKNVDSPHEEKEIARTLQVLNYHINPSKMRGSVNITDDSLSNFFFKTLKSLNSGRGSIQPKDLPMESLSKLKSPSLKNIFMGLNWYLENIHLININKNFSALNNEFATINELIEFVYQMNSILIEDSKLSSSVKDLYSLMASEKPTTYKEGEGEQALNYIVEWINENALDSLVIYEPYFSEEQLFLFMSLNIKQNITIISHRTTIEKEELLKIYKDKWRELCDHVPPSINFIVLTSNGGRTEMHDRVIIGDSVALKIGTSFNSFKNNTFSIEALDEEKVSEIKGKFILPILINPPKEYKGADITVHQFQL